MTSEFRRWRIGAITVTRIIEMADVPLPADQLFPAASAEQVRSTPWLKPCFVTDEGRLRLNFQCFLIEAGGRRILVDTCIGEHKQLAAEMLSGLVTGFLETLRRAGAGPEDVDTVLCTHLHFDHVGWNTRLVEGQWRPTFPKARYLFAATEVDFTLGQQHPPGDEFVAQSIRPVLDAGLADLVATDHVVCEGVRFEPTPGHTPGHVSVWIESDGERALISGDAVHHPLQLAFPDLSSGFCHEPARGAATRRRVFGALAGEPVLFIGTHFCEPTAGRIRAEGEAWRLETVTAESLAEPAE